MAKILLIGGACDGQVHDRPERINDIFQIAVIPDVRPGSIYDDPKVVVEYRTQSYRICAIRFTDDRDSARKVTEVRFGHPPDMHPSEALVMLMQNYQKG